MLAMYKASLNLFIVNAVFREGEDSQRKKIPHLISRGKVAKIGFLQFRTERKFYMYVAILKLRNDPQKMDQ